MRLLDRYIGRSVLLGTVAVLSIVTGISILFVLIDELRTLSHRYTLLEALFYVILSSPRRIYELVPMASLIGCLVGLGALASHSELIVMRAAGISLQRILWAVMKPTLIIMLASMVLGEYIVPASESLAESRRALLQDDGTPQSQRKGPWLRQGDEFVHINSVQPDGTLLSVTRYRFDENRRLTSASFAKKARFEESCIRLYEVATTYIHATHSEVITNKEECWQATLDPQLLVVIAVDPESLSMQGLWRYATHLEQQGQDGNRYWLAFWNKALQPIATATLVLLAISFIVGPLRSVTMGQRLFTGVVIGFVFKIGQDLLGPSSLVFGFSPLLAVLIPAAICALAGLWLLKRAG